MTQRSISSFFAGNNNNKKKTSPQSSSSSSSKRITITDGTAENDDNEKEEPPKKKAKVIEIDIDDDNGDNDDDNNDNKGNENDNKGNENKGNENPIKELSRAEKNRLAALEKMSNRKKNNNNNNNIVVSSSSSSSNSMTNSSSSNNNNNNNSKNHSDLNIDDLNDLQWQNLLAKEMGKEYFIKLKQFLKKQEASKQIIYPPVDQVFSAFNACSFEDVKVVILGQDPYHGMGQAHGLCFSVQLGIKPPPSLKNICKEAINDVGILQPTHGNLENWSKQGVLLLNTCFTVNKGNANSHSKQGWERFTDQIIKVLNAREDSLVFLCWGKPAQERCKGINKRKHHVITSSHPSPLGAYKTKEPFMGSKCFSRANQALIKFGKEPINWNL